MRCLIHVEAALLHIATKEVNVSCELKR